MKQVLNLKLKFKELCTLKVVELLAHLLNIMGILTRNIENEITDQTVKLA